MVVCSINRIGPNTDPLGSQTVLLAVQKIHHDGCRSVGVGPDTNGTTTEQRRLDQRKFAGTVEELCGVQYQTPQTCLIEQSSYVVFVEGKQDVRQQSGDSGFRRQEGPVGRLTVE